LRAQSRAWFYAAPVSRRISPVGTIEQGADLDFRARIRNPQDLAAGLLFVAVGVATIVGASDYPLGTIRSIGPGYYPILLGIALTLLGGAIGFNGLTFAAEHGAEDDGGFAVRPLVMVVGAVAAFGLLVRPYGLAAAIVALIGISSLAGRGFGVIRVLLLCVGMVALSWLVFIFLLGLNMSMWPR
jgi:hypothetical protein